MFNDERRVPQFWFGQGPLLMEQHSLQEISPLEGAGVCSGASSIVLSKPLAIALPFESQSPARIFSLEFGDYELEKKNIAQGLS